MGVIKRDSRSLGTQVLPVFLFYSFYFGVSLLLKLNLGKRIPLLSGGGGGVLGTLV